MSLDTLLQIARAATVRDEYWSEYMALFDRTFSNPSLITKMIEEITSARACGCSEWGGNKHALDKAREALDAELDKRAR